MTHEEIAQKIEELEGWMFQIDMQDHWNTSAFDKYYELMREKTSLQKLLAQNKPGRRGVGSIIANIPWRNVVITEVRFGDEGFVKYIFDGDKKENGVFGKIENIDKAKEFVDRNVKDSYFYNEGRKGNENNEQYYKMMCGGNKQ